MFSASWLLCNGLAQPVRRDGRLHTVSTQSPQRGSIGVHARRVVSTGVACRSRYVRTAQDQNRHAIDKLPKRTGKGSTPAASTTFDSSPKASRRLASKPTAPPAKPEPNALRVRQEPGKTNLRREAKVMVDGMAMNAMVGLVFSTKSGTLDLTECFAEVLSRVREAANRDTKSQEAILVGQIISMNAVYTDLAIIARQNLSNLAVFEVDEARFQGAEQLSSDGRGAGGSPESPERLCTSGKLRERPTADQQRRAGACAARARGRSGN